MDTPTGGVDPIWYERFQLLAAQAYSSSTYPNVAMSSSGGTPPTFTAPALTSNFSKIGKLVFMNVGGNNVAGGTPGAGAQQLSISLPLPVAADSLGGVEVAGTFANAGTEGICLVRLAAGAVTAPLLQQAVSGSKVNIVALTCGDFNNVSRTLSLQFFYPVD